MKGNKDRLKAYLAEYTLIYLREIGYKWKDIIAIFMISSWTLFEPGLKSITGFSNISDEELDLKIKDFKELHGPAGGRSLAMCYLRQCGLRVRQEQVTKTLLRVDPEHYRIRWAGLIKWLKYSVSVPNSSRYADGHHRLIS